jgi:hypothetical protein
VPRQPVQEPQAFPIKPASSASSWLRIRHEQSIRHPLLEIADHRRLGSWD